MTRTTALPTADPKGSPDRKPARLLVVDDDPLNREIALDQLALLEQPADTAENGQEAIEMVARTPYDLILMDVQMPVMDGLEASRRILALPGRNMTPIVAMTANAYAGCRDACLAAGMVDYLVKPVDLQLLQRSLAHWLPAGGLCQHRVSTTGNVHDDTLARLVTNPGFDIELGMSAIGWRVDKYIILLRKYQEVHGGTPAAAQRTLAANDRAQVRRLAHTLKGTAATLGLKATRDAALALEQGIAENRDDRAVAQLVQQLAATHAQQLASLAPLLDPPPAQ